jgi:lipopolysaccharide biosynthesis glycosyltransferase
MKVCFGVISIGRLYIEEFERLFKPSVSAYCAKYGYDLKIFTDFLDPAHKHADTISFQKCLVPSLLMEYDLVVVLDADIYIETNSPPIHSLELNDRIGIVNEVAQSTSEAYSYMVGTGFADLPNVYYKKAGIELETDKILNTGVMICNPRLHASYLKQIYEKYIQSSIGHPRGFHYEQACIGYELQKDNKFTVIPNTWNFIYIHSQITNSFAMNQFFIHFAGMRGSGRESALSRHSAKRILRWGVKQ